MDETDTFLRLSRKPIAEVYELVFQKIVMGFDAWGDEFPALVESYGYTYKEYLEYCSNGRIN
jgi:hypothetical protein